MSHTHHNKDKLIARIRRIKGQLEGVERALEAAQPCGEILRQLSSVRGAMTGLTREVLEDHLLTHVVEIGSEDERRVGGEEMIDVLRSYMK